MLFIMYLPLSTQRGWEQHGAPVLLCYVFSVIWGELCIPHMI